MVQKFIIVGRLTKDPESKPLEDGTARVKFTVAVDRQLTREQKEKNIAEGHKEKNADFFEVTAWRKLAESIVQHKRKGDLVLVEATLRFRSYDDKDGVRRRAVDITAHNVEYLANANGSRKADEAPWPDDVPPEFGGGVDESDVPF